MNGLFSISVSSFHSAPSLLEISELCIFGLSCAILRRCPRDHTMNAFIGRFMWSLGCLPIDIVRSILTDFNNNFPKKSIFPTPKLHAHYFPNLTYSSFAAILFLILLFLIYAFYIQNIANRLIPARVVKSSSKAQCGAFLASVMLTANSGLSPLGFPPSKVMSQ